mmetsp:Transcript_23495/g.35070  ORF Transcript_23495/g.35070 Transcript_23495/m.35070 type:complete len:286 (-) Transcript_23495:195-1052(-)
MSSPSLLFSFATFISSINRQAPSSSQRSLATPFSWVSPFVATFDTLVNYLNQPVHSSSHSSLDTLNNSTSNTSTLDTICNVRPMSIAETSGVPGVRITAVAAASCLRVIKCHIMPLVIRMRIASMTKDTSFVRLARPANPDNIIPAERVLTNATRDGMTKRHNCVMCRCCGGIMRWPGRIARQEIIDFVSGHRYCGFHLRIFAVRTILHPLLLHDLIFIIRLSRWVKHSLCQTNYCAVFQLINGHSRLKSIFGMRTAFLDPSDPFALRQPNRMPSRRTSTTSKSL